jgi:hypothetical protein
MSKNETSSTSGARRPYAKPGLTIYGSVRDLTGGQSQSNPGDTNGMMNATPSERGYKENIRQVGTHPAGFGLYLFDYKPEFRDAFGHGRKFGVMADEVEKVVPEAVVVREDGYRGVDYSRIGITLH